jgi:hypothetical protein
MFKQKPTQPEQEPQKTVEVVLANAIALDPAKKYLLVMDSAAVSTDQADFVLQTMRTMGMHVEMALLTDGDAFTSVQVIEVN